MQSTVSEARWDSLPVSAASSWGLDRVDSDVWRTCGNGVGARVGLLPPEELGHWLARISGRWWRRKWREISGVDCQHLFCHTDAWRVQKVTAAKGSL